MALKPKRNCRSKGKAVKSGIKTLFEEYCSSSSVHGVRYFTDRERSRCEKYWWAALFLVSILCCGWWICSAYRKWQETPVIVSIGDKTTPVWKIPLPAVTICPRSKVSHIEEIHVLKKVGRSSCNRFDKMLAVMQICQSNVREVEPRFYDKTSNKTCNESYISLIENISTALWKESEICKLGIKLHFCVHLFNPILTEEGICYTFNSLSEDELLRTEILSHDRIRFGTVKAPYWSFEDGYSPQANILSYPYRTLGAGAFMGLRIPLSAWRSHLGCSNHIKGFKVHLHSPVDYPQFSTKFIDIPIDQQVVIAVKPQILTTSHELKSYYPERRQCFFNQDRKLDFFRVYTQDNCKLECVAKYTLQQCGCVKFSMIRTEGTPVCEVNQIPCVWDAEDALMKMEFAETVNDSAYFRAQCNCLPACTSIQYDVEITQSDYDLEEWGVTKNESDHKAWTHLTIHYKESQFITSRRNELYGSIQFLASCGGFLGLFMGTSLLSMIELCYFCSVRPFMLRKKWKQMAVDIEQGESDMLPCTCLSSINIKKQ